MASYYQQRAARDPAWREQALATAAERHRRAMAADPEHVRDYSRRYRARLREHALTITELLRRSPIDDPVALRLILNDEVRRGRVDSCGARYLLNGGLDHDTKLALRDLEL